jgi:hypothetical protein
MIVAAERPHYLHPVPRAANVCPNCGEPVSQFAAGCAICGANLEAWRRELAERRVSSRLPRPPAPRGLGGEGATDVLFAAVMALVSLFAPPFGLLLGGFMAYRFDRQGRTGMRNVALGCALAALLFVLFPFGVYARVLDAIY